MSEPCYHCQLPALDSRFTLTIEQQTAYFCCPGCLAITQLIYQNQLQSYYHNRDVPAVTPQALTQNEVAEISSLADPTVLNEIAMTKQNAEGNILHYLSLSISGISCAACLWLIETRLSALPGVETFRVNLTNHRAQVTWDNSCISLSEIIRALVKLGYKASPYNATKVEQLAHQTSQHMLKRLLVSGLGCMQVMMFAVGLYAGAFQGIAFEQKYFLQYISLIVTTVVLLYAGSSILHRAYHGLASRALGMDVPIAAALLIAFFASLIATYSKQGDVYYDSICMFVFLLTLSRYLEMRARNRAAYVNDIAGRLIPQAATLLEKHNGETNSKTVVTHSLKAGDLLLIKSGEALPADGRIVFGKSTLNESLLSGESTAILKTVGDKVYAGSINLDSALHIEVDRPTTQSMATQITQLVERTLSEKPNAPFLIDVIAKYFATSLLLIASAVYSYWTWASPEQALSITLSVLIVACPCALSLATPTALTVATQCLARLGFVISKGHVLNTLPQCTYALFDKTGTLTIGQMQIAKINCFANYAETDCVNIAKQLESISPHPIAKAFQLMNTKDYTFKLNNHQIFTGLGIEGTVNNQKFRLGKLAFVAEFTQEDTQHKVESGIYLASEQKLMAHFELQDMLNPSALPTTQALSRLRINLAILSGDSTSATQELAEQLSINTFKGSISPVEKLAFCQQLQNQQQKVLMIGDGINDSPAMAAADVSLSMPNSIDITKTHADAFLIKNNLALIPLAIKAAKATAQTIKLNMTWAIAYNLIAIPLAALGYIAPYMAALGMSLSSLLVVFNSIRLSKRITALSQEAAL